MSKSFMLRGGAAAATREPVPADAGLIADLVARACTGGCAKACGIVADKARGDPRGRLVRPLSSARSPRHTFTIPMDPKGDDDRAQDLCMGTKRKYDWKLEAGMGVYGINCDGDSEVEGDVFWTMPPDYRLSY